MRISSILAAVAIYLGVSHSFSVYASEGVSVIDPSKISMEREANSSLLARVLEEEDEIKRYNGVVSFLELYGPWINLEGDGVSPRIYVSSYLLQSGNSEIALSLLKNGLIEGWLSYRFMDGVANDFLFALKGGHRNYLKVLFSEFPKGLNTPMAVQLEGEKVTPLSILATREYMEMPFYDDILTAMLEAGANPGKKMSSGISPLIIASSTNNMRFVRVVQNFNANKTKSLKGLMSNTPLEESEVIEMQAIADALIEQPKEKKASYQYDKLHSMWISMILKGYNVPADLMYEELKSRKEFNLNKKSSGGLTPLMAATMSPLYGGNVEYAKRLIERGANPRQLIVIEGDGADDVNVNLIQLALQKDNFKIVALMIANGVNFISPPDNEELLILSEAMEQKAYVSATILKQALVQAVNYNKSAIE